MKWNNKEVSWFVEAPRQLLYEVLFGGIIPLLTFSN